MGKTVRKVNPKLKAAILRNHHKAAHGLFAHPYGRDDERILRGQDGAIRYDKCQTAMIDSEGGYKLNNHDYIYSKNQVTEPTRRLRVAGKKLIARQLEEVFG